MPITLKAMKIEEERTYFPTITQFRVEENPCYPCSLITGIVSPILHLPHLLLTQALWPFAKAVFGVFAFVFVSMFAGVMGRASGYRISKMEEVELTREDKETALRDILQGTGYVAVPLDREFKGGSGEH